MSTSYTVSKIPSYILYLYRLPRSCCIDTDYNLQILICIYTDRFLYIQITGSIDTAYKLITVSTWKIFPFINWFQRLYTHCIRTWQTKALVRSNVFWQCPQVFYEFFNMTTKEILWIRLLLAKCTCLLWVLKRFFTAFVWLKTFGHSLHIFTLRSYMTF